MAESDYLDFSPLRNIPDDSPFVHRAMYHLGFLCDFADLTTEQMRVTLAMADYLKRAQGQPEMWGVVRHGCCRILERLQNAELSESDTWFRGDYRQAYICVSLA